MLVLPRLLSEIGGICWLIQKRFRMLCFEKILKENDKCDRKCTQQRQWTVLYCLYIVLLLANVHDDKSMLLPVGQPVRWAVNHGRGGASSDWGWRHGGLAEGTIWLHYNLSSIYPSTGNYCIRTGMIPLQPGYVGTSLRHTGCPSHALLITFYYFYTLHLQIES